MADEQPCARGAPAGEVTVHSVALRAATAGELVATVSALVDLLRVRKGGATTTYAMLLNVSDSGCDDGKEEDVAEEVAAGCGLLSQQASFAVGKVGKRRRKAAEDAVAWHLWFALEAPGRGTQETAAQARQRRHRALRARLGDDCAAALYRERLSTARVRLPGFAACEDELKAVALQPSPPATGKVEWGVRVALGKAETEAEDGAAAIVREAEAVQRKHCHDSDRYALLLRGAGRGGRAARVRIPQALPPVPLRLDADDGAVIARALVHVPELATVLTRTLRQAAELNAALEAAVARLARDGGTFNTACALTPNGQQQLPPDRRAAYDAALKNYSTMHQAGILALQHSRASEGMAAVARAGGGAGGGGAPPGKVRVIGFVAAPSNPVRANPPGQTDATAALHAALLLRWIELGCMPPAVANAVFGLASVLDSAADNTDAQLEAVAPAVLPNRSFASLKEGGDLNNVIATTSRFNFALLAPVGDALAFRLAPSLSTPEQQKPGSGIAQGSAVVWQPTPQRLADGLDAAFAVGEGAATLLVVISAVTSDAGQLELCGPTRPGALGLPPPDSYTLKVPAVAAEEWGGRSVSQLWQAFNERPAAAKATKEDVGAKIASLAAKAAERAEGGEPLRALCVVLLGCNTSRILPHLFTNEAAHRALPMGLAASLVFTEQVTPSEVGFVVLQTLARRCAADGLVNVEELREDMGRELDHAQSTADLVEAVDIDDSRWSARVKVQAWEVVRQRVMAGK